MKFFEKLIEKNVKRKTRVIPERNGKKPNHCATIDFNAFADCIR